MGTFGTNAYTIWDDGILTLDTTCEGNVTMSFSTLSSDWCPRHYQGRRVQGDAKGTAHQNRTHSEFLILRSKKYFKLYYLDLIPPTHEGQTPLFFCLKCGRQIQTCRWLGALGQCRSARLCPCNVCPHPEVVQLMAYFCPKFILLFCRKFIQTLSSMSRFCPLQIQSLSINFLQITRGHKDSISVALLLKNWNLGKYS